MINCLWVGGSVKRINVFEGGRPRAFSPALDIWGGWGCWKGSLVISGNWAIIGGVENRMKGGGRMKMRRVSEESPGHKTKWKKKI